MSSPIRTFIAADISAQARVALNTVAEALKRQSLSDVQWVRPEAIHLTLKFLGDIHPNRTMEIMGAMEQAAQGIEPFVLCLSTPGAFPNPGNPRVLWVGLGGDLGRLKELQRRIEHRLEGLGFPREPRAFTPHLTLGRVRRDLGTGQRRRIGEALEKVPSKPTSSWEVQEVHLIRSTLKPEGAIYSRIGTVPLEHKMV